jgi:hypothetical protein
MKSKYFYFFAGAVSLFIVLINLNYSPQKIALLQLEKNLLQETNLNALIEKSCNQVLAQEDNMAERFFLERFSTATAKITDQKQCTLNIQNTSESRFHLLTYWYYGITLHNQEGTLLFDKQYSFSFRPPPHFKLVIPYQILSILEIFTIFFMSLYLAFKENKNNALFYILAWIWILFGLTFYRFITTFWNKNNYPNCYNDQCYYYLFFHIVKVIQYFSIYVKLSLAFCNVFSL